MLYKLSVIIISNIFKMSYVNFLLQDHIEQCNKFPVTCPNSCGVLIPREMVCLSIFPFQLTSEISLTYCYSFTGLQELQLDVLDGLNSSPSLGLDGPGNALMQNTVI